MDHSDLAIILPFKNRLMLKILGISDDLNDILDELDTILSWMIPMLDTCLENEP
jgi:hypothetical protein